MILTSNSLLLLSKQAEELHLKKYVYVLKMAIDLSWVLVKVKEAVKSWTESFQGRSALEDLCPCLCSRERDLIFKSSPEKDNGEKEPA